ncbi:hypothetical protein N4R57_03685 [Rhodobacteraceae bacterium D3-12]|nr:hypothetical protein N4R57_03685 [Rhodobacteraceae bacterium D3-12]
MEHMFKRFVSDEKGNVTTDRLVLGAGVFMLCTAFFVSLGQPPQDIADNSPTP